MDLSQSRIVSSTKQFFSRFGNSPPRTPDPHGDPRHAELQPLSTGPAAEHGVAAGLIHGGKDAGEPPGEGGSGLGDALADDGGGRGGLKIIVAFYLSSWTLSC